MKKKQLDNNKNFYKKVYINGEEYIEKQQLISFLEDKIKEDEGVMEMSMGSLNDEFVDKKVQKKIREKLRSVIKECENKINAYQEVLYFINKGGKDD